MKRYIRSSSVEQRGTIIRLVDPLRTAGRGFGSNELYKLWFNTSDMHEALAIAASLQEELDPELDPDCNIAEEYPEMYAEPDSKLIDALDSVDVGSGEVVIFSVRVDGKLVYRSGLRESEWGKMPNTFSNYKTEAERQREQQEEEKRAALQAELDDIYRVQDIAKSTSDPKVLDEIAETYADESYVLDHVVENPATDRATLLKITGSEVFNWRLLGKLLEHSDDVDLQLQALKRCINDEGGSALVGQAVANYGLLDTQLYLATVGNPKHRWALACYTKYPEVLDKLANDRSKKIRSEVEYRLRKG